MFKDAGFWTGAAGEIPGRETWEAFWDGGPRNKDGGGSRRSLGFAFGDCDIFQKKNLEK